jgi:hypothetical protein
MRDRILELETALSLAGIETTASPGGTEEKAVS